MPSGVQAREERNPSQVRTMNLEKLIEDEFKKQWDIAFKKMCVTIPIPGDTMYHDNIRELTDFGKLLHKEGLWSLYTYDEGRSLLYHLCRGLGYGIKQANSPVRPRTGDCTACGSKSPDEIRGLWTLHNFDWLQQWNEDTDVL